MHWDKQVLGVALGLLAPVLGFFAYAAIYTYYIRPHMDLQFFVEEMFLGTRTYQAPILSLSLLANLALFFLLDRFSLPKAMRGVILATFIYAVAIVVLSF
jgi:hypothetical protein